MAAQAQEEADRRIRENDEKNRVLYETRCRDHMHERQKDVKKAAEDIKEKYQSALEEYRAKISKIKPVTQKFCLLLDNFLKRED